MENIVADVLATPATEQKKEPKQSWNAPKVAVYPGYRNTKFDKILIGAKGDKNRKGWYRLMNQGWGEAIPARRRGPGQRRTV
jgi:hypothetical protein